MLLSDYNYMVVQFTYEEKYIDDPSNEVWADQYRVDIPVIHLNGRYLMKHRVNEKLLRKTLEEGRQEGQD